MKKQKIAAKWRVVYEKKKRIPQLFSITREIFFSSKQAIAGERVRISVTHPVHELIDAFVCAAERIYFIF